MAVLKSLSEFEGSIGNIIAYKRRDSDKIFLRAKGGVSKKRIQHDKNFARTRELNAEWSGCAKAAAMVRDLFHHQDLVTDFNLSGPLTAIAKEIQVRDPLHIRGERAILFSRFGNILEGFQLNRKNTFEAVIRGNIDVQFLRVDGKAIIQLPELIPDISFIPPVSLPAFNIRLSLGTLPDMLFIDKHYAIADHTTEHYQLITHYATPWYYTGDRIPAQTIEMAFQDTQKMGPHDLLVLTISVNFGTPVTHELVKTSKHTGAGKILKVNLDGM